MGYTSFYFSKIQSDVRLCIQSAGHSGMEDGCKRTQAHKCEHRVMKSGGSKASFQSKKQEGYCQWTNFQRDLVPFYFAVTFQKLSV